MPFLLHIETATDICSIAISKGNHLLALHEDDEGYSHAAKITLLIDAALKEAAITMQDLEGVVLSSGPGSYTALRIGTSAAKGICYALEIPLIVVDTLQSIAQASCQALPIQSAIYIPMIDARRMEVYTAGFNTAGETVLEQHAKIIDTDSFQDLIAEGKQLVLAGNGAPKCQEILNHPQIHFVEILCSATHLIKSGYTAFQKQEFADVAYYTPQYLKAPHITTPKKVL